MGAWKLWIGLGLFLAILELLVVPAQFLLLALGVCAVLVGVLVLTADLSIPAQVATFAVLAAVLVPAFVWYWRRVTPVRYAGTAGETPTAPQVATVVATDPLTIVLRSDRFPAEAIDGSTFEVGEKVRVDMFSGITAGIRKIGSG